MCLLFEYMQGSGGVGLGGNERAQNAVDEPAFFKMNDSADSFGTVPGSYRFSF